MNAASKRQKARRATSEVKRVELVFNLSNPRDRELWERLEAVGRGKATFIKQRLAADLFGPRKRRGAVTPDVIREILRSELGKLPAGLPAAPEGPAPSGGLDMSRPRRSAGPPRVMTDPRVSEPALTPEDSARMLVASIRGYGTKTT